MKTRRTILLALAIVLGITVQSHATLTTIGTASYDSNGDGFTEDYKLIYDTNSPFGPIVWLDYTNGSTLRYYHEEWFAELNTVGVLTYNLNPGVTIVWGGEWRLPLTEDGMPVGGTSPSYYDGTGPNGYNIMTSEMGHLFYTAIPDGLGNLGRLDTSGLYRGEGNYGLLNTGDFDNLRADSYWSDTMSAASPEMEWFFSFRNGLQNLDYKYYSSLNALAVRFADVMLSSPPEGLIENIQKFFDDMVASGELVGSGPTTKSAKGRVNALHNMLSEAEALIESGSIEEACNQLNAIYKKTDGAARPPDFVEGPAAAELAERIYNLMDALSCE